MEKESRPAINWEEAYARLEPARRELEAGGDRPSVEVTRILRERAQALARPLEEAPIHTEMLELLVFSLTGERYGVETVHVLEVISLRELTPVPCTPAFVLGVVNHRGRILSVLDFRRLFDLRGQVTEGSRVVAVAAGGMVFGIFAESVSGTVPVPAHNVAPPPATLTGDRQAFILGVTEDMVAVLDLEAIVRDQRIVVNEKIG